MTSDSPLLVGDPAPWFRQRCTTPGGDYSFDMTAGRHVLLYLFRASRDPQTAGALAEVRRRRALFDDRQVSFFGVSRDAADHGRLAAELPGIRHFLDADGIVGRLYGCGDDGARSLWYLLDPLLRVRGVVEDGHGVAVRVLDLVASLPSLDAAAPESPLPALLLPDVFEPGFCDRLIEYYDASEARASGVFTADADGTPRTVVDSGFKRRHDCTLRDRGLAGQVQARIVRRVVPEIRKAFQFDATCMERLILACYDARDRGCFGAHRDNTVRATAHRRFAVSINLNDAFEGGELVFPEFGHRRVRPGRGGAIVFSCSLMHAVTPVRAGRRLACLPFVHDEAAARVKQANRLRDSQGRQVVCSVPES